MPEDFGRTGIDPDWYDNGPGSEACKLKLRREMAEHDAERFGQRARDSAIVKAAEAETEAEDEQTAAFVQMNGITREQIDADRSEFDRARDRWNQAKSAVVRFREARRKAVRGKEE